MAGEWKHDEPDPLEQLVLRFASYEDGLDGEEAARVQNIVELRGLVMLVSDRITALEKRLDPGRYDMPKLQAGLLGFFEKVSASSVEG